MCVYNMANVCEVLRRESQGDILHVLSLRSSPAKSGIHGHPNDSASMYRTELDDRNAAAVAIILSIVCHL